MTTRLYYDDGRMLRFEATVTGCVAVGETFEVTLDRTAFYPSSGGQPFDLGTLGGAAVVEVIDRDDDVVHVVERELEPGGRVQGVIDAERRRDHMEQHTGQHVLSAAFERLCGVATVGFHLGAEVSTIDLAREVTVAEMGAAEDEANRVIRGNRPVAVRVVPADEVAALALRRESKRSGPLRVIEIEDCDVSACGGTHADRTGEIGLVMIVAAEKVRGGTRLSFLCGGRSVRGCRERRERLTEVARLLGVAQGDVVRQVERLQDEARGTEKTIKALRDELVRYRAVDWRASAETMGACRVVLRISTLAVPDLKRLAQEIVAGAGLVAILIGEGDPTPMVVARSTDVEFDAGAFMTRATGVLGGRGGGRTELAQGGLLASAEESAVFVRQALADGAH